MNNQDKRRILHVDMDAFFAAVEVIDNPKLKNKPLIVGGVSSRGVVCTCSYEARKYGVHSAMPIFKAKALCPNGVYVPTRHWRYKEVSRDIFSILYSITPKVEPLSIDEAYLDISHLNKSGREIALEIKRRVKQETGLTISVGISYNKFLAKLASDWNKPDGIKEIHEEDMPDILFPLNIRKVYGIGKKSAERLNRIGVVSVEDLFSIPLDLYKNYFGKWGEEIYWRIRGVDKREVSIERERKSFGKETTFKEDIKDREKLWRVIKDYAYDISVYMKRNNIYGKTLTIKYKTRDFETHTKSKTFNVPINDYESVLFESGEIFKELDLSKPLRLIGLTMNNLTEIKHEQLKLDI